MVPAPRESMSISVKRTDRSARIAAIVLGFLPALAPAAGSLSFARQVKSVRELIIAGDRPEISACLYSAQLAVDTSHEFERLRWSDSISDASVVREYLRGEDWVRVTRFEASGLTQRTGPFSRQRWADVMVECQQVNEAAPVVTFRPKVEKALHQRSD
jgi:hypothetical protein